MNESKSEDEAEREFLVRQIMRVVEGLHDVRGMTKAVSALDLSQLKNRLLEIRNLLTANTERNLKRKGNVFSSFDENHPCKVSKT